MTTTTATTSQPWRAPWVRVGRCQVHDSLAGVISTLNWGQTNRQSLMNGIKPISRRIWSIDRALPELKGSKAARSMTPPPGPVISDQWSLKRQEEPVICLTVTRATFRTRRPELSTVRNEEHNAFHIIKFVIEEKKKREEPRRDCRRRWSKVRFTCKHYVITENPPKNLSSASKKNKTSAFRSSRLLLPSFSP